MYNNDNVTSHFEHDVGNNMWNAWLFLYLKRKKSASSSEFSSLCNATLVGENRRSFFYPLSHFSNSHNTMYSRMYQNSLVVDISIHMHVFLWVLYYGLTFSSYFATGKRSKERKMESCALSTFSLGFPCEFCFHPLKMKFGYCSQPYLYRASEHRSGYPCLLLQKIRRKTFHVLSVFLSVAAIGKPADGLSFWQL